MKTSAAIQKEQQLIKKSCPILTPSGCTRHFCQSGRMSRPLEPQLGENRSLEEIRQEAEAFLCEIYRAGAFKNDADFRQRLKQVMNEIESGAIKTKVWKDSVEESEGLIQQQRIEVDGISSKGWVQTKEELEWGIRLSWRNSRKCIMRARFQELSLVDLRDVKSSREMVDAIIRHLPEAYNGGRIRPSVFVFPPRSVNQMGPMFWSKQFLNFAGYEMEDGTILGDPANVALTKDIIDIGWSPPEPKSRWDVLPLVAMAEGDEPAIAELPKDLTRLIEISHPFYKEEFEKMQLKWVRFPALSRLGFDIGGVQYTAAPFIGWFMDAEIGVRNLADTFRYNCLPDVAKAIGYKDSKVTFGDLPSHEKLVWLSRAQAELNYAVYMSFLDAKVTVVSSLAASESYSAFDDQHQLENGYRLNSDPYWIAPPQGSIIPLWHRGAAPNYQPKPMITKHRYDPVKVWKRKNGISTRNPTPTPSDELKSSPRIVTVVSPAEARIHLYYSGTGETAKIIALKLRSFIEDRRPRIDMKSFGILNTIDPAKFSPNDIILVVVSSTGEGDIPSNGQRFSNRMAILKTQPLPIRYAVFGIGDSGYTRTFNGAAKSLDQYFREINASAINIDGASMSDVAIENPPFSALHSWWSSVDANIDSKTRAATPPEKFIPRQLYLNYKLFHPATVYFRKSEHKIGSIMRLALKLTHGDYTEMGTIRLVPHNSASTVDQVLALLEVSDSNAEITIPDPINPAGRKTTIREFLTYYVDLLQPFQSLRWVTEMFPGLESKIEDQSVLPVLESLFSDRASKIPPTPSELNGILLSMSALRPRTFSIASAWKRGKSSGAEILLRIVPQGRFSDIFLSDLQVGGAVRYQLLPQPLYAPLLRRKNVPLIAVACGTGVGVIRSFVQSRIRQAAEGRIHEGRISLFLGFQVQDKKVFIDLAKQASEFGILDSLHMVPSNQFKIRIQDRFQDCAALLERKLFSEGGYLHICGRGEMVQGVMVKLGEVLGGNLEERLGKRLLREMF